MVNSINMENLLRSYQLFSEAEIKSIVPYLRFRHLEKGDYLIKAGKICTELAFVQHGLLRSYYTKDDGEEITYCFTFENTLMTAYSSLITGLPSPENIQALMPTELWVLQKKDLEALAQQSINWVILQKRLAEQQYVELENRIFSYQKEKASKRYQDLLLAQPHYLQQIPLQYLASYLGITRRHLSRIRREILERSN